MTPASTLIVSLLLANHPTGLAFPLSSIRSSSQRVFTPRSLVTKSPAHEEAYDQHEFLDDVNFTATMINGRVVHNRDNVTANDPIQSLDNLTQKILSLSSQFEYQLSLAKDDRGYLLEDLESAQADRQQLQSLVTELRRDKETLAQTLNETKVRYREEKTESESQIHTLQLSATKQKKALKMERTRHQQLEETVSAQEQQIEETESSSRRLLMLLWKLYQRRIRDWVIWIFPFFYRLLESLIHFFDTEEEECIESSEVVSS